MSQCDIDVRNAVTIVGRQLEVYVPPSEADIRMMIGRLGKRTDSIHELQSRSKIFELKAPAQGALLDRPSAVERLYCGRESIPGEQFTVHIVDSDRSKTLRYTKCF